MVESSKILTVSYGTFSCTLEGFEDSFTTMKAIAEYFRDLAAGDRYFGAEPPTPDAEMLARIAEREIARRVEMRTSETGIVLRASDPEPSVAPRPQVSPPAVPAAVATGLSALQPRPQDDGDDADTVHIDTTADDRAPAAAAPEPVEPAPVMPPAPRRPASAETRRDQSRAAAEDADVTQEAPAPSRRKAEAPAHPDADSVAAKLQRIRAVVGGVTAAPVATSAFAEDLEEAAPAAETEPAPGSVTVADAAPVATETSPAAVSPETAEQTDFAAPAADGAVAEDAEMSAATQFDNAATTEVAADDPAQDEAQTALSEDETDAAIARAMAVFGGADVADKAHVQDLPAATADDQPVPADPGADAADDDDTDDQISAVLRNLQRAGLRAAPRDDAATDEPEIVAKADEKQGTTASTADATTPAAPPSTRGRILRVTRRPRPDDSTATSADAARDRSAAGPLAASDPSLTAPAKTAETPAANEDDTTSSSAAPIDAAQAAERAQSPLADAPAQAAEIAMTDDADATADVDFIDDDLADDAVISVADLDGAEDLTEFDARDSGSSLSDEDEADLQRTLTALKLEVEAEAGPAATPVKDPEAVQKPRRDELPDTSEAEMSRIMSQANEELADPEASRRRNAIAHLKAAVAATEAARQLGETGSAATATEDAFRDDLEQVVRPRRAPRPEAPTERSERPRPAPLKLVASQRIDLDEAAPAAPVQPRRVASVTSKADDAGNFAEFAESMGATSLQDLLEAAAAYTAYVEGSEDFSRPHIMQKVRQTVREEFSREDGLRSFGTLLRQGRIERSRNGRFTVTEGNRFKPESMAAGG